METRQEGKNKRHDQWFLNPIRDFIEGGGIRTPSSTSNSSLHNTNKTDTNQAQKLAKTDTYKNRQNSNLNKTSTSSEQDYDNSLHKKCAICVHQNFAAKGNLPSELIELIRLWPKLPTHIKQSIRELIKKPKTNRISRH